MRVKIHVVKEVNILEALEKGWFKPKFWFPNYNDPRLHTYFLGEPDDKILVVSQVRPDNPHFLCMIECGDLESRAILKDVTWGKEYNADIIYEYLKNNTHKIISMDDIPGPWKDNEIFSPIIELKED